MATLDGWKTTTTIAVIDRLPLQSYVSALTLVEAYLSNVGGWQPVIDGDPTGEGVPANGASEIEAADAIAADQMDDVFLMSVSVPVTLELSFPRKLNDSLTLQQALAAIQPLLENWLSDRFSEGSIPATLVTIGTATGTIAGSGNQTAQTRSAVQELISAGDRLVDPVAIAVARARIQYDLDDTWNADQVYTEDEQPLVVIVRKYTDSTYTLLDPDTSAKYILDVDTDTYAVSAGVISGT